MSFCAEETDEKDKWNVATRSSSSLEKLGIFPSGQVIRNYLAIDLKSDAIIDEVTLCFLESSKWMFLNSSICPADSSSWTMSEIEWASVSSVDNDYNGFY